MNLYKIMGDNSKCLRSIRNYFNSSITSKYNTLILYTLYLIKFEVIIIILRNNFLSKEWARETYLY